MYKLSYAFLTGFLTTTLLLQWFQEPTYPFPLLLGLSGFLGIFLLCKKPLPASALLGISLSFFVVAQTTHAPNLHSIDYYAERQNVTLEGIVVDEPDRRPLHTKYTVEVDTIDSVEDVHGKVLVSDYRNFPLYEYGDRVSIRGLLERPEPIEDFRYDHYLARYGIYAVIYRANILALSSQLSFLQKIKRSLYTFKVITEDRLNSLYPEPHASFMAGLLTGSRKGIPEDTMEDFNTTGLTHIIAISGYNITIVIAVIAGALFWLQPHQRLIPSIGAIILFTVFVGASAAVVRAAIMGILGLIALHVNRLQNIRLTILWTAFFMVVWNPKILWYDAGFQLSFLAVLGLVECAPLLDPLFTRIPNTLGLRESLQMTIAAQLSAVPLIVVLFGRVSLIAPIANVLVAPAIPFAMLFGTLSILVGFLSLPLGLLIASAGWLCLEWILIVAHVLAHIPFASLPLKLPVWVLVPYYTVLFLTIHRASHSLSQKAMVQA